MRLTEIGQSSIFIRALMVMYPSLSARSPLTSLEDGINLCHDGYITVKATIYIGVG
jgi:hypothetical protein